VRFSKITYADLPGLLSKTLLSSTRWSLMNLAIFPITLDENKEIILLFGRERH
jgi:hypothetical protein